jgi:hypothetical protein
MKRMDEVKILKLKNDTTNVTWMRDSVFWLLNFCDEICLIINPAWRSWIFTVDNEVDGDFTPFYFSLSAILHNISFSALQIFILQDSTSYFYITITFSLWILLNQMHTTNELWENHAYPSACFISETIDWMWNQWELLWIRDLVLLPRMTLQFRNVDVLNKVTFAKIIFT